MTAIMTETTIMIIMTEMMSWVLILLIVLTMTSMETVLFLMRVGRAVREATNRPGLLRKTRWENTALGSRQ